MANRFTATEKWIDPWFCGLNEKDKLFWIYLVDNCDHAGIWQVNWPLVRFHIKDYEFKQDVFNERIVFLRDDKWFIPKFIDFQYKTGLNPENRAHASVLSILKKEGALKGLTRSLQGRKDKDKRLGQETRIRDKVKRLVFIPPTLVEVSSYCQERKNGVDPKKWLSHYEAKGWMIGKNKMVNWQAAVRTWEKPKEETKSIYQKL